MTTPPHLACLAIAALLLSGCSSGGKQETAAPPAVADEGLGVALNNTTAAIELPITLELTGCLQLHTFFPFPVAMFAQLGFVLPQGFAYDSADGHTVHVLLAWWSCPEGRLNNTPNAPFADVRSMFAAMPVQAPAELTAVDDHPVPVQLDLVPLTWIINSQLAADHLGTLPGLRDGYVQEGEVRISEANQVGPLTAYSASATATFGVFSVDPAFQAAPAANPAGRYRVWLAPDEVTVTGYLDIVNSDGDTLGSGYTDLRFNGDPDAGAPPATGGTAHVVDATGVVVTYNRLNQAA